MLRERFKDSELKKKESKESIVEKCDRLRAEGEKFYKTFEEDKREQERFYRGDHWKFEDPSNRPKNHIFQVVESEIPLLMDPMPSTDILAHDDENFGDHALVLKAGKDHVYRQQNLFIKDAQMIRQALKTGTGYQFVDFDPEGERGEGTITVKNLARKQVIRDPAADNIDQARYVFIDVPCSDDDGRRRFPKTWDEIAENGDQFLFASVKGALEKFNVMGGTKKEANRFDSKDIKFIEMCFLKDNTLEAIPADETQAEIAEESAELMNGKNPDITRYEDHVAHIRGHMEQKEIILAEAALTMGLDPAAMTPQDIENLKASDPNIGLILSIIDDHIEMHKMYLDSMEESENGKRPKYPNGIRLVIKTGKTVHFDGAPEVDDGLVPLVELECYKDEGPAEGVIKNLIPMQKTINEMDAKELKGLKVAANPGWLVDKQSGVDPDSLTDEDGIVVQVEQGTMAQRLQPGQVSVQLEQRIRRDYEAMNRIEGTGETVFGEAPKGDPSGVMLRRLQQQALGRIRLKSKMVEVAIYRRDLLILSRIMKYWSTERKLRTEDANGAIRFVKFDPRMMENFTYELAISPGSATGMDNEAIAQTYKELLLAGLIDLKSYAILTNIPKKQDLIAILEEKDQMAIELQNAQAMVQEAQTQALMTRANLAPQTLSPEELGIVEKLALEEQAAAITSNPMALAQSEQARGNNETPVQV